MNRIFDFLKYLKSVDGATMILARRMHKVLVNVISSLFALLILGYFLNICCLKGVNILFGLILVIGALCAITKPDLLLRLVELGAVGGILSPNQTVEQSVKNLTTGYIQTVKVILFFWSFGFFTLGVISFTSSPSLFWVLLLGVVVLALWPSTTKENKITYTMSPVRKGIVCVMAIAVIFLLAQQWGFLKEGSPKEKISSAVDGVSSVVGDVFAGEPEWIPVGEMTYDAKNIGWSKISVKIPSGQGMCRIRGIHGYHQFLDDKKAHAYIPPEGKHRAGCILENNQFEPLAQLIKVNGITRSVNSHEFDCSTGIVTAYFTPNMQTSDPTNYHGNIGNPVFTIEKRVASK